MSEDNRRIVYVVTEGSYSDYGIVSIWANKEDAEKVVAARGSYPCMGERVNKACIEEWPLNQQADVRLRRFMISLYSDGSIEVNGGELGEGVCQEEVCVYAQCCNVLVAATSLDKAKKIGLDLITQKKAQDAGIT